MIEARFLIEAQGNHRDIVKNSLKKLSDKLRGERGVTVEKEFLGEVTEEDGMFSSVLELDMKFNDFLSFVHASMFYTPSAIEMMEPPELLLDKGEFLEGVAEVVSTAGTIFSKLNAKFNFEGEEEKKVGLMAEVIEGLLDGGAIRAKIVVEKTGKTPEEAVSEVLKTIGDQVYVNAIKSKEVEGEGSSDVVVGIDAIISDPATFVDIAMKHTPVLIDIKEPDEIVVTMLDLQDICLNLSSTIFELSYNITQGAK